MADSKPNALELAKQGNSSAIAALLNGQLQSKGITAIVTKDKYFDKEERLKIIFEFDQAKSKDKILLFTQNFFQKLNPESISKAMVYGRKKSHDAADWRFEINLCNQGSKGLSRKIEGEKLLPHGAENKEEASKENQPQVSALKKGIADESKATDSVNVNKPYFGCLVYWLWLAFGFCAFTAAVCFVRSEVETAYKLVFLSLVTFPPAYTFIGSFLSKLLPQKRLFKKGIRDLAYMLSFSLLYIFSNVFISSSGFGRNSSPKKPSQNIQVSPLPVESNNTTPTPQNSDSHGIESPSEDYPGQTEIIEEFGRERYEELGACQDELIARGATVEELVEACNPSEPEEITPLSQEEAEELLCSEAKDDPSNPWYSDCSQRGF